MTMPSNSPEEGTPPSAEPTGPTDAIAAPGSAEVAAPPPPGPPPPTGPPGPPWGPAAYPFAPVARAPVLPGSTPRDAGALVFGGGGLLVGHALSDHGNRHSELRIVRMGPGEGMNMPGFGRGQLPRRQFRPGQPVPGGSQSPASSTVPSASPTK